MSRYNIPSTIEDPAYRYTMPRMNLQQESRLNGVKTNVRNLDDVAGALRVPQGAILKYFCSEVGANSEDTSKIKGQFKEEQLRVLLDKFIKRWVICAKCNYPELAYQTSKKELTVVCNACGHEKTLDTGHKAGKQMLNDIAKNPHLYKTEIKKNNTIAPDEEEEKGGKNKRGKKTKKRVVDRETELALEEARLEEQKIELEDQTKNRVEQMMKSEAEPNILDAQVLELKSTEIENAIEDVDKMVTENGPAIDDILTEIRHTQLVLNITPEYKYYILLNGVFNAKRNIVKHWAAYEKAFLKLVSNDREAGPKRLFQAIIIFFSNRHPEQQKYASSFCKQLYDRSVYSDEFFKGWHSGEIKLDKACILYDKKAEKTFKPLVNDFIQWLDYGEEEEGDGEEYGEEEAEEPKANDAPQETEIAKNQRLMIEQQKKAQIEKMAAAKLASEQQKRDEEAKEEEEAKADPIEEVKTQNIARIEVEDEFDIADI